MSCDNSCMITVWPLDQTRVIEVLATPKKVCFLKICSTKRNADIHTYTDRKKETDKQTDRDGIQDL